MYMCHPNYPVYKLTRNADDDWTYAELAYKWPPLQDENIKNITVTPSATGGNISISASSGIFSADDVGSTWQIGHNMAGNLQTYLECPLANVSGYTTGIRVRGAWTLTTFGTWSGELRIIRTTYITGITETIRTYHNAIDGQRNISTTGNEDNDCVLYIQFITAGSAGSSNPMARLEFANAVVYGLVKITSFSSATLVYGTVTWGMAQATATTRWSEPAFNKKWGYPRTACLHETRLILGGSRKKPLSVHGSQIDDYENFQRGTLADHAFMFTLSANESNPINWMVSQTSLLIGTAGNEWSMDASDDTQALGPGNVQANNNRASARPICKLAWSTR